jgi:hypothetical protein
LKEKQEKERLRKKQQEKDRIERKRKEVEYKQTVDQKYLKCSIYNKNT